MNIPFEEYSWVPFQEAFMELEGHGLLEGKNGASHMAMWVELCCAADKRLMVEICGKQVLSGWTPVMRGVDFSERLGVHPEAALRTLRELSPVLNRERYEKSYRYQLKAFERNHDRLERLGEVEGINPFEGACGVPSKLRSDDLRKSDLLHYVPVSLYNTLIGFVDEDETVRMNGSDWLTGWTIPLAQSKLERYAGANRITLIKWLGLFEDKGLIERQRLGQISRYRPLIWVDALASVGNGACRVGADASNDENDDFIQLRDTSRRPLLKQQPEEKYVPSVLV